MTDSNHQDQLGGTDTFYMNPASRKLRRGLETDDVPCLVCGEPIENAGDDNFGGVLVHEDC